MISIRSLNIKQGRAPSAEPRDKTGVPYNEDSALGAWRSELIHLRASAPLTTSRISLVIVAWRVRLCVNVKDSRSSEAFCVAFSIADIRAPSSDAADSNKTRNT